MAAGVRGSGRAVRRQLRHQRRPHRNEGPPRKRSDVLARVPLRQEIISSPRQKLFVNTAHFTISVGFTALSRTL